LIAGAQQEQNLRSALATRGSLETGQIGGRHSVTWIGERSRPEGKIVRWTSWVQSEATRWQHRRRSARGSIRPLPHTFSGDHRLLPDALWYTGDDRRILLRVRGVEGRVCFTVEDNGIGIAESDQKKIFRRFFQVDRRLARRAGGVGLGLSIVEYIVKAHRGEVSVTSQRGVGSKFSIFLSPSSSTKEVAA
jgi:hypothetical protein